MFRRKNKLDNNGWTLITDKKIWKDFFLHCDFFQEITENYWDFRGNGHVGLDAYEKKYKSKQLIKAPMNLKKLKILKSKGFKVEKLQEIIELFNISKLGENPVNAEVYLNNDKLECFLTPNLSYIISFYDIKDLNIIKRYNDIFSLEITKKDIFEEKFGLLKELGKLLRNTERKNKYQDWI